MTKEDKNEDQLDPSLFIEDEPQDAAQDETNEREPAGGDQAGSDDSPKQDDVPDKYRGKSAMEIIKMHQDAERLIGTQGNEVGQLRRVVDDLIEATKTSTPAQEPEEETNFFEDPNSAVEKAARKILSSDPDLQELKRESAQTKRERSAQAVLNRHPDAEQIAQDPAFGEWVSKSKVRMNMFNSAHTNFDADLATELFDLWKDRKTVSDTTAKSAKDSRAESVKNASTGSGRQAGDATRKPILSRERLIELKSRDPNAYYAQIKEFEQAYREGRVR